MARSRSAIQTNAPKLAAFFDDAAKKEIPFASAIALNRLGRAARDKQRARLGRVFTLRKKSFRKRIINTTTRKAAWPNQKVHMGHRDEFMVDHEVGATRRGTRGHRIAVPTRHVAARKGVTGKVPKRLRVRELLKSGRGRRVGRPRAGGSKPGAIVKVDKRKKKNARGKGLVLWVLLPSIRVKKRYEFRETARRFARDSYSTIFKAQLKRAIESSKAKARLKEQAGAGLS